MPKATTNYKNQVKVITDPRDASRDRWMAKDEAQKLFDQGKLAFDATNGCYTTQGKQNGKG